MKFLKKKYKLGIVTNGDIKIQKNKIKSLKINKYFDKVIYARSCKREKPFKYSFEKIIKYFKCKKKNVLFIGDNYNTDIIGAGKFGLKTVHLSNNSYKKNTQHIRLKNSLN